MLSGRLWNTSTSQPSSTSTSASPIETLIVNATSKVVRLPSPDVTLSAFAMPPPSPDVDPKGYEYNWKLMNALPGGEDKGTTTNQNSATLRLSDIKPGVYSFQVTVKGTHSFGSATANLTVLPPLRVNTAPVAMVEPVTQVIRLPSNSALIDGSASQDDDKVVTFKWTLEQAPIGYSLPSAVENGSEMLKLVNLTAGNYTLKLTVTDSDGATNSTLAYVRVEKEIDYPPVANAGEDIVVYLPVSSVVLNGSKGTTDDRGIVSWEWTRGEGANLAVDMRDTRNATLTLSKLVEGVYSFVLKVTDTANQTASDEVRVFVKPPEQGNLVSNAGRNVSVTLPVNGVLLDGSGSSPGVKTWNWTQIKGPQQAVIEQPMASKTMVKSLTRGEYAFNLTVSDGVSFSWSVVNVTVVQTENAPPKASAGPDVSVTLPCAEVLLNGTGSTDDVGIVKWEWTRLEGSSAAGTIVGNSAMTPVLKLVDLIPGHYEFKLRVQDEQSGFSEDTVSIIVKPSPNEFGEVELTLNVNLASLTSGELKNLVDKLELLLDSDGSGVTVAVVKLFRERRTGRAVLRFLAATMGAGGGGNEASVETVLKGRDVALRLRQRLWRDPNLLGFDALGIESVICQNECSGVGRCDEATRDCRCDPFWMENPVRRRFGDGEANCDWSLIYVAIVALFVVGCLLSAIIATRRAWKRKRRLEDGGSERARNKRATKHRYSLLNGLASVPNPRHRKKKDAGVTTGLGENNSVMVSDSDTGSDVLFQARRPAATTNGTTSRNYGGIAGQSQANGGVLVNIGATANGSIEADVEFRVGTLENEPEDLNLLARKMLVHSQMGIMLLKNHDTRI
ncbi:unnamed protein product, partial [Notodromas monacha]